MIYKIEEAGAQWIFHWIALMLGALKDVDLSNKIDICFDMEDYLSYQKESFEILSDVLNVVPKTDDVQLIPSVKPLDLAKPTGMDPVTIGLSVASIGAGIFGASKQEQAAREQAQAVEDAAKTAAAATEKAAQTGAVASLRGKQAGFGYDYLTSRYEGGAGGALARVNAARDLVQKANIEANNPAFNTLRSVERYEDRLRGAMPGFVPPSALFV